MDYPECTRPQADERRCARRGRRGEAPDSNFRIHSQLANKVPPPGAVRSLIPSAKYFT